MEDEESTRDYETYLEQSVVVLLRDGRYLYGLMKSFDQFNSIALDMVIERIFHGMKYAERKREMFVIRGENISMIGLGSSDVNPDLEMEDFDTLNSVICKALKELRIH